MGAMHCNIGENHTILYRHVDHKCFYEAKTNGQLLCELWAVTFQSSLPLTFQEYWCPVRVIVPILLHVDSGSVGCYN